mmetsp:Transcript_41921/g.78384  ORF Transcript_41921/g.78384 Transcript_41921/m.78384 type:complete len:647 (-) Transcript_41921:326-2266(-)
MQSLGRSLPVKGSAVAPWCPSSRKIWRSLRHVFMDGRSWLLFCLAVMLLRLRFRQKRQRFDSITTEESSLSPASKFLVRLGPAHRNFKKADGEGLEKLQFGLEDDLFQLVTWIGDGGFANVYLCRRMKTGNQYAAKVINMSSFDEQGRKITNLQREIRVMRELHHPRIVNLHESFWVKGGCIIVMDLATGGDLRDKLSHALEKGDHPFEGLGGGEIACKFVASQLIDGINYMHEHNVLHRDLKLENILITSTDTSRGDGYEYHEIKIADFGLSKFQDDSIRRQNTAVGTPTYVAPEVLEDDIRYDERVDFWSFGVILYAALCGCMPFSVSVPMRPHRHKSEVSRIRECDSWHCLSPEARSFIRGLLTVGPEARLVRCSEHPWLSEPMSREKSLHLPCTTSLVKKIVGRTSAEVHSIEFHLRDGSKTFHGTAGGLQQQTYVLEPKEYVMAVMQEFSHPKKLGSAIVFYTTSGRILKIEGKMAWTRHRFVAPMGDQIIALQFDGSRLAGVYLKEADANSEGEVEYISGCVGSAVDYCKFQLRNGTLREYGAPTGNTVVDPWKLQPGEFITIVEQFFRDWDLGTSLAFYTSGGRVFKLVGMAGARSPRFAAARGQQICGINFTEHGHLSEIVCASIEGQQVPDSFKAHT